LTAKSADYEWLAAQRLSALETYRRFPTSKRKGHTYLQPLHAHGLIAKIPHSRRWRLTKQGRIAMTAAIQLRDVQFAITYTPTACHFKSGS